MADIIIKGGKVVNNPDGSIHIVFDQPEVPSLPTVPVEPTPEPVKEFDFGLGYSTGKEVKVLGESFMSQTSNNTHSLLTAINSNSPVFRFQVNPGDVWESDKKNKNRERSEFYHKGANYPNDKDTWISYAFKVEGDNAFTLKKDDFIYLGQCHASPDDKDIASNPVFGLKFSGVDQIELVTSSTSVKTHTSKPKSVSRGIFTINRKDWNYIVIRVKFSPTKGEIQLWLNGKEMVNFANIGIGYNDNTGPYWKFGVYRSPSQDKIAVQYANMEIGRNESLQDRILKPLKIE